MFVFGKQSCFTWFADGGRFVVMGHLSISFLMDNISVF